MSAVDKSRRRKPRFSLSALFILTTLVAVYVWAWRAGQRDLVMVLLVSGTVIYYRVWVRRQDPLSQRDLIAAGVVAVLFLWCFSIFAVWMWFGPKVRYDIPITEQKQGEIMERPK